MLSNQKETVRCLYTLYIVCAVFLFILVVYLQQPYPFIGEIIPQTREKLNSDVLFNISNFMYVLNIGHCNYETTTVFIVTSYAGNFETRSAIRQAYPVSLLKQMRIQRVFLLALISEEKNVNHVDQEAIVDEHSRFNDLIQGSFIEDYKNLTYKHVMGLKWVTEYCKDVRYVVKMDHDIVFNLFAVDKFLQKLPLRDTLLIGHELYNMKPIRNPFSKWYVKVEEYSLNYYPKFLSGWFYITNPHTARLLYDVSKEIPYFWIDDAYVTGMLSEKINLKCAGINNYYTTDPERIQCCIKSRKVDCPFWIGPNGGNDKLIIEFARYSEECNKLGCFNDTSSPCKIKKSSKNVVHILRF